MEDGVRSADPSSGVIKKKNSSGCLIIKKKGDGVGGFGSSGSKKPFDSRKEKKRSRLILTDSGSSDELLEPIRRKVADRYGNSSASYKKGYVEDGRILGFESDGKRSGLDVFEFDEYDGFDGKKMRRDYVDDRLKLVGSSGNHRESGNGSSRNAMVDRKKDIFYERRSSMSGGKSKGLNYSGKSRYETEEDESHLPISFLREKYREAPDEAIRLQGKNGVLKVMVNKKKQSFPDKSYDYQEAEDRKGSRSEAAVKKNKVIRPSFCSDSKRPEKPVSFARKDKSDLQLRKSLPVMSSKAEDSETDDSDTSLKQESTSEQARRSTKAVKNKNKRTPTPEIMTPLGGKEGKVKRGSGTEKQLLREKIRSMLIDRGWTIDYRPRRNRDYLDAVYINPAGTAYWSIIKAYDALQKQLDEEDDNIKPCSDSTPFTPLPEEILSKLTRQTRKKIEREMKRKKRDGGCSKSAKEVIMKESAEGTDSEQREEKLSFYMKQNHKSLKGRLHEADHVSGNDPTDNLYKGTPKQERAEKISATNSHMIQGRKSRKIGRCTLLVRRSDKGLNSETDGFVPYSGKRTLLSWLIDSGIVHMSDKVQYMNRRKKVMLEGWITKDGIHCGCCSKILTISKFEIHAGSKQRQPPNIYLESGLSLLQCQIDAWNRQKESERRGFHNVDVDGDDPNDDTCGLCGDGGDLICCDGCPSTFHQSCLDIQMLPVGDWHCPNCTCKFCGFAGWTNAEANDKTNSSLLLCSLCDKKYHQSCSQEVDDLSVDSGDATNSFCGKKCQEVYGHLQKLLGVKHELEAGFSWSLVHRMDPASETLHLGFSQRVECNSKLAVALSVMDECFLPIVDRRSGINLIHNVLYNCGSNFSRLNYSGFYTAILERGDEIISAASIRIHGTQLAEMPFIGTRHIYRRQGMCRRLLCAIESALSSLKVEKLIIPAITEHMHTWTANFNFNPLEESHKQEMRSMNMLVFPGTDMLQKLLAKREIMEGAAVGTKSTEVKENHLLLPMLDEKSELNSSPEHDLHMSDDTGLYSLNENNNKASATSSALQSPVIPSNENSPVVPSNDIAVISSSLNSSCEPKQEPTNDETLVINSKSVNKITESSVNLKSVSPSDTSPDILEAENSVLGSPVKDHTRSSSDDVKDDALKENVIDSCIGMLHDSLGETSASNMEEEAIAIQNSVSASTIHGTCEIAVDLGDAREINVNDTIVKPVDSVEQTFAKNTVDENAAPVETSIQSNGSNVAGDSHEVNEKDDENAAPIETSVQSNGGNVASDSHEVNEKVAYVQPVLDSSDETSGKNNTSQVNSENLTESSCGTDGIGEEANGNLEKFNQGDELGDAHKDVKVAFVEPVLDSLSKTLVQNRTQVINENLAESTSVSDESTIHVKSVSGHQSAIDMESELHVATEVASTAMH